MRGNRKLTTKIMNLFGIKSEYQKRYEAKRC